MDLKAYLLRFECRAVTRIATAPFKGSMVRGALFAALRRDFCMDKRPSGCPSCGARQVCPVCSLLATVDDEGSRGGDVARPCAIEPPLETETVYQPADRFSFGVTLFGHASDLLPYVVLAVQRMGESGIGNQRLAPGRFSVEEIVAVDPVRDRCQAIFARDSNLVRCPEIPVTHEAILSVCGPLKPLTGMILEFLTPARLIADGALVKSLSFPLLIRRLLRRLTDLTRTATGGHPGFDHEALLAAAESVRVVDDATRWVDVPSWSSRQGRFTPIGGLLGEVAFEGDMGAFAPWLLWGTITHVGKDATKGGGMYRLRWRT